MRRLFRLFLLGLTMLSQSVIAQQDPHAQIDLLERRKLELEIRDLSKLWLLRSEYLSAILPALIGALTVFVLYKSGYFKAEAIRLENKRTELLKEIRQFESQKAELARLVRDREADLKSLEKGFAEAEIIGDLERLVRIMVPNNVLGIQQTVNRALGVAPNESELIAPTLLAIRNRIAEKDDFASLRRAILHQYLESPTTPTEMTDALREILDKDGDEAAAL
jgi:hypothetical protein